MSSSGSSLISPNNIKESVALFSSIINVLTANKNSSRSIWESLSISSIDDSRGIGDRSINECSKTTRCWNSFWLECFVCLDLDDLINFLCSNSFQSSNCFKSNKTTNNFGNLFVYNVLYWWELDSWRLYSCFCWELFISHSDLTLFTSKRVNNLSNISISVDFRIKSTESSNRSNSLRTEWTTFNSNLGITDHREDRINFSLNS